MSDDPETGMAGFVIPDDDAPESDLAIISKMARALRDVIDLSIPASRAHHYIKHDIPPEQIAAYDGRAKIMEEARRSAMPPKEKPSMASIAAQVAGTTALLALGMFCICITPDCAQAAYLTPEGVEAYTKLGTALGVLAVLCFGVWLLYRAIGRMHVGPIVPLSEDWSAPYGAEPSQEQRFRNVEGQ